IDADRALFDHQACEPFGEAEMKQMAAIPLLPPRTKPGNIYMALHHMAVQPVAQLHRSLQVKLPAYQPMGKVGLLQRFIYCRYRMTVRIAGHYGKTYAIVRDRLVDLQLFADAALYSKMTVC